MVIFPEFSDAMVEQVQIADEITVTLRATSPTALCPCCGTETKRVQSRYTRHLHDLPSGERALHLRVEVRRFFCPKATCRRKIFAERFPFLALPNAQRTLRLQQSLRVLGFALTARPEHAWANNSIYLPAVIPSYVLCVKVLCQPQTPHGWLA